MDAQPFCIVDGSAIAQVFVGNEIYIGLLLSVNKRKKEPRLSATGTQSQTIFRAAAIHRGDETFPPENHPPRDPASNRSGRS